MGAIYGRAVCACNASLGALLRRCPVASVGAARQGEELSGRFMQCFLYTRAPGLANDHFYAHPLDMVVNLDMNTQKVRPHPSQTRPFLSALAPHQCHCSRKGDKAHSTTPVSAQLRPCLLDIRPAAGAQPGRNDYQQLSWGRCMH